MYMKWQNEFLKKKKKRNGKMTWQKMVTWTHDWILSWHLTEEILMEMNGMTHLTTKQTYRAQIKTFEVRGPKIDFSLKLNSGEFPGNQLSGKYD
jgi:hypothetical protein